MEGPRAVAEALAERDRVVEVFVTPEASTRYPDLAAAAEAAGAAWTPVGERAAAQLSDAVTPPGVVAVCRFVDVPLGDALAGAPRLVVVCAEVRDPGNAGTILRTADAAGADAVVLAGDAVDLYNPKTLRASVGSLFHLPVAIAPDPAEAVAMLRAAGLLVLAADGAGASDLDDLADDGALARPTAWLFGNEARGLPGELAALSDARVAIPIHGRAESLNLSTAAAVCLYASARAQRRG